MLHIQLAIFAANIKSSAMGALAIVISFFAPVEGLILAVGAFIFLDTIMGIGRSIRKKESVTSRKLSRLVTKMFLYQLAMLTFFILDKYIANEILMKLFSIEFLISKLIALTLCFIEITSINENFKGIFNKSLWETFKELLSRTKEIKGEIAELTEKKGEEEAH